MPTPDPLMLADTARCWIEYLHLGIRARYQTRRRAPLGDDVLLLAWAFPPEVSGGVYRPLSVANHFARAAQPVRVVSRPAPARTSVAGDALQRRVDPGVRVHRLPDGRPRRPSRRLFPHVDSSMPGAMRLARECLRLYGNAKPRVIIATGPPFHDFVAGFWLSRIWNVPLMIDYRDEWTQCPFDFVRLGSHDAIWERRINAAADAIVFVSRTQMEHHLRVFGPELSGKSVVIPNGWEPDAMDATETSSDGADRELTITFAGTIGSHTPVDGFLEAFAEQLVRRRQAGLPTLRLQFLGRRDKAARRALETFPFQDRLLVRDEVPQREAIAAMRASDVLLIVNTPSLSRYIPGKLYDYLASGIPVLSYGRGGEIERILALTSSGLAVAPDDPAALETAICRLLAPGARSPASATEWLAQHTRDAAASRLLEAVRRLTAHR